MSQPKPTNPFYAALLVVGVVFAVTACAYCVMTVRGLDPQVDQQGLMRLMNEHGLVIMVVELVALGVLTFAAIGTDEYWTRRAEGRGSGVGDRGSEVSNREGEAPAERVVGGNKP